MYDTIIIGAGMSGLAAGIRLAYFDRRVCVLERHYTIGGLNSFYRLNGRDYDAGLHAVTNFTPAGAKKVRWPGCFASSVFAGKTSRCRRSWNRPSPFRASSCVLATTSNC
ncbi:MAG: NAD(P)-binding protein [Pirellulaceae bacterium]